MGGNDDERDPDRLHDALRDDDMARTWSRGLFPARPIRSDEDVERDVTALRRRAEHLVDVLHVIQRDESPPTIPDADEGALAALILLLEERIARAANKRGHSYGRRALGLPMACPWCARPVDRAAEPCLAGRQR